MKRRFSEIDSTNNQLEKFRLSLEQMKKDIAPIAAEQQTLETILPDFKKAKATREDEVENLKKSLAVAEKALEKASADYAAKETQYASVKKEVDEKEEAIENTETIYNALNSHKKHLSGQLTSSSSPIQTPTKKKATNPLRAMDAKVRLPKRASVEISAPKALREDPSPTQSSIVSAPASKTIENSTPLVAPPTNDDTGTGTAAAAAGGVASGTASPSDGNTTVNANGNGNAAIDMKMALTGIDDATKKYLSAAFLVGTQNVSKKWKGVKSKDSDARKDVFARDYKALMSESGRVAKDRKIHGKEVDLFVLIREMLLNGGFEAVCSAGNDRVKKLFENLGFDATRFGPNKLKKFYLGELYFYENMLVNGKPVTAAMKKKILNSC